MAHIDQLHPRIQFVDLKTGLLTPFAFKFLSSAWERLGGPDDAITELENGELYETGVTDSKLTELTKQVNELELIIEMERKNTQITALEKRIAELELQVELLSAPNLSKIYNRLDALEIDLEMNYGA